MIGLCLDGHDLAMFAPLLDGRRIFQSKQSNNLAFMNAASMSRQKVLQCLLIDGRFEKLFEH